MPGGRGAVEELRLQIAALELRLHSVQSELSSLKERAASLEAVAQPGPVQLSAAADVKLTDIVEPTPPRVASRGAEVRGGGVFVEEHAATEPRVASSPPERRRRRRKAWFEWLRARALAIAGGIVTLLGIFFFVNRAGEQGWVGPELRIAIAAAAAAATFGVGLWLRRRFGESHSALAAVGVGIAGGYATLLFAAARYELVPNAAALAIAGGIAAIGVATALAWRSELVAGIGLVGAMIVPLIASPSLQTGLTEVGTAFVVIVLAAAGVVGVRCRWAWLLAVGGAVALPQCAILVVEAAPGDSAVIAVSVVYCLVLVAIGVARGLPVAEGVERISSTYVLGSTGFVALSALQLIDPGVERGLTLLAWSALYAAVAALIFARRRDLSMLLVASAAVLGAGAAAALFSDNTLGIVWVVDAAVLAWLARQVREIRFQVLAVGYATLALAHTLAIDAPVRHLFVASAVPEQGIVAVLAVAASFAAIAATAVLRGEGGFFAPLAARQHALRVGAAVTAGALLLDAASLAVLALAAQAWTFSWGEAAVTALWGVCAAGLLLAGTRRAAIVPAVAGIVLFGCVVAKTLTNDRLLDSPERWWAMLVAGVALLAGGYGYALLNRRSRSLDGVAFGLHAAAAPLIAIAVAQLLGGDRLGEALLVTGVGYVALAAAVFTRAEQRDHATLLGAVGLALAAAAPQLTDGTAVVLVWAAGAALFSLLAEQLREPRLLLAGVVYELLGVGATIAMLAPLADFLAAGARPGHGVPALVSVVAGGVAVARGLGRAARREEEGRSQRYSRLAERLLDVAARAWTPALCVLGVLALYAVSLAALELLERLSPGTVAERFQRGHTIVSALWAFIALALLYAGLVRRIRTLRVAAFALFGAALAKIFLYDLSALTPVTRALSFMAVGAVLLVAGFFYQRLIEQLGARGQASVSAAEADVADA